MSEHVEQFEFGITAKQVQDYRTEHGVGLTEAHRILKRKKMIEWLEKGGTAEPILLCLLKDGEWL